MALHNEGDWRMETWQRARRASCHVSKPQSPSCVTPFWTHAKCLLAFTSYFPMWIKATYTFIKTAYSTQLSRRSTVSSGVLFWTACTRRTHLLPLPSRWGKSDSWLMTASVSSKNGQKSRTITECGHVTLNWVKMASKQAKVEVLLHIFQFTRRHGVTVIQGLTFQDSVVTHFKSARWYFQALDFWLCTNYTLEMCCASANLENQVSTSLVKTLVIRMYSSYRCFKCQER